MPPFEQLRLYIADRISTGKLPVGTRLPSVRALAVDLGISANTVARAYRELEAAGILTTGGRAGTVVSASQHDGIAAAAAAAAAYVASVSAQGVSANDAIDLVRAALAARKIG